MRDTSDMMEDALSEDTMMDCGSDGGGLEDLVDLATDIADSSPTIRDAAERLLTLLGVDESNEDLSSSSEDEGVEVDVDEFDEDDDEPQNTRLLHQLAASLAQELKYSQQCKQGPRISQGRGGPFEPRDQSMEVQETDYLEHSCQSASSCFEESDGRSKLFGDCRQNSPRSLEQKATPESSGFDPRLRIDELQGGRGKYHNEVPGSWGAGWDACATEALRYLVEDEGLPPHHPTVLAMKNHLDVQRERAFAQYTV